LKADQFGLFEPQNDATREWFDAADVDFSKTRLIANGRPDVSDEEPASMSEAVKTVSLGVFVLDFEGVRFSITCPFQ
jgi:hypothetical protein